MFFDKITESTKVQLIAQLILAVGLIIAAFTLGYQTKNIGSGRSSVQIKGLAEKPIKADSAQWTVTAQARGNTFADALSTLRKNKQELLAFIEKQGLTKENYQEMAETVEPFYTEFEKNGRTIRQQEGYQSSQDIIISSKDLPRITDAYKNILDYKANHHAVEYQSPQFLVSNLEEIKISLIHAATGNAKLRAQEFIRGSDTQLGSIRSASQGAFYILATGSEQNADDYGGTYDKSTIDKIARVVVTVDYHLQ